MQLQLPFLNTLISLILNILIARVANVLLAPKVLSDYLRPMITIHAPHPIPKKYKYGVPNVTNTRYDNDRLITKLEPSSRLASFFKTVMIAKGAVTELGIVLA